MSSALKRGSRRPNLPRTRFAANWRRRYATPEAVRTSSGSAAAPRLKICCASVDKLAGGTEKECAPVARPIQLSFSVPLARLIIRLAFPLWDDAFNGESSVSERCFRNFNSFTVFYKVSADSVRVGAVLIPIFWCRCTEVKQTVFLFQLA